MTRNIYEVYAKIVDSTGRYATLDGYPKVFDSNGYDGDIEKTKQRAYGAYYECLGSMCKVDPRQIQIAMIIDVNSGIQLEITKLGDFPNEQANDMELP